MNLSLRRTVLVAASVAATAVAIVSVAPAAGAATGYTVTPGGNVTAKNSGSLTFVDVTSTSQPKLVCTAFSGTGSAVKGSHSFVPKTYTSPTGLDAAGALTTQSVTGCTNNLVGPATITPSGTWSLGISKTANGTSTGYLYNITAKVVATNAPCSFTATGAVYGKYKNSTGIFTGSKTGGLTLSNVTGSACGLVKIANGDKAYLSGKVKLAPIQTIS